MIPWLKDREKFSFMGLELKFEGPEFQSVQFNPTQSIVINPTTKLPQRWRDWIGSIRAEQVEGFNLLLRKPHALRGAAGTERGRHHPAAAHVELIRRAPAFGPLFYFASTCNAHRLPRRW
jgi:hypothetical protein